MVMDYFMLIFNKLEFILLGSYGSISLLYLLTLFSNRLFSIYRTLVPDAIDRRTRNM